MTVSSEIQSGQSCDPLDLVPDPLIGRALNDAYLIEMRVGGGAMGVVYAATQLSLAKPVAVKVLRPHLRSIRDLSKRFCREAKAASLLDHPNSVRVFDFGETAAGELFIVMERLEGEELATLLAREYPLGLDRIVRIVDQILAVLAEAHSLGIIHRDLKPENVMLLRRQDADFVKVCDFGIAKLLDGDRGTSQLTELGMVCGTPEYMSPEQARGEALDGRSDLYALGVLLYKMTTGRLPFVASTALGVVTKHITEMPLPPGEVCPDLVDRRLEKLILWCLEKDRESRPRNAEALRDALCDLLRKGDDGPALDTLPRPRNASRLGLWIGSGVLAGGMAIAVWIGLKGARSRPFLTVSARVAPIVKAGTVPLDPPFDAAVPASLDARLALSEPGRQRAPGLARRAAPIRAQKVLAQAESPPAPLPISAPPLKESWHDSYEAGMVALRRGQPREAIRRFERASTMPGRGALVFRQLGAAYSRVGDRARMLGAYESYVREAPNAPDIAVYRAIVEESTK